MITVTDIKQYMYCKRIIYFTYCMPIIRKKTYKMKYGKREHDRNDRLEPKRTLKRYGLEAGEKRYGVELISKRLGLRGKMDLLIVQEKKYIPVELKYSTRDPGLHHKYQLSAYCLLVEDQYKTRVRKGIIHLIPRKDTFEVEITANLRRKVKDIIKGIRELIDSEELPPPVKEQGKCKDCEYYNFCGDV
ncbi:CRISPR-associated Cas4 family exonuclease [Orenia metallireducens]|uniref:CRISPR-associated exonuclease Cas4 n=1 Tax=Orenia metallireducens TaxID=1413210 RepID=A0A285IAC4_9FIRM|nr:CRISPR-associated protein Cas4 [Orenia metallireducens]PRX21216.1 CRISPR-associated Cas4 family exonuclease [Orenia metallireducens]SNY44929.1 CRISPR-associated exonuclease, Cas4 family [Orenia metallireducens]